MKKGKYIIGSLIINIILVATSCSNFSSTSKNNNGTQNDPPININETIDLEDVDVDKPQIEIKEEQSVDLLNLDYSVSFLSTDFKKTNDENFVFFYPYCHSYEIQEKGEFYLLYDEIKDEKYINPTVYYYFSYLGTFYNGGADEKVKYTHYCYLYPTKSTDEEFEVNAIKIDDENGLVIISKGKDIVSRIYYNRAYFDEAFMEEYVENAYLVTNTNIFGGIDFSGYKTISSISDKQNLIRKINSKIKKNFVYFDNQEKITHLLLYKDEINNEYVEPIVLEYFNQNNLEKEKDYPKNLVDRIKYFLSKKDIFNCEFSHSLPTLAKYEDLEVEIDRFILNQTFVVDIKNDNEIVAEIQILVFTKPTNKQLVIDYVKSIMSYI